MGRKSKHGCGFFWAFECRWCVEKKHFNLKCHQEVGMGKANRPEFRGNKLYSPNGRVYLTDFVDCFQNHGMFFLDTYRLPAGRCWDMPCYRPQDEEFELVEMINNLRAAGFTCPPQNGKRFTYEPNAIPLEMDCRLFKAAEIDAENLAKSTKPLTAYEELNGDLARTMKLLETPNKERLSNQAVLEELKKNPFHCNGMMTPSYKWIGTGRAGKYGDHGSYYWSQIFANEVGPRDTSCLPSAEAREGLTLTSNAQSTMITSEDFTMYGFALVGLISVLFFLRSAFRSYFSEYKTIDETTTLEEVSA